MTDRSTYIVGIGGNIGDTRSIFVRTRELLNEVSDIKISAASSLYRTKPWGLENQDDFLNGALEISSSLLPEQVLKICLNVEKDMARIRDVRWGPRTVDLDVLWWSGGAYSSHSLTIPHKHLAERAFALVPLLELKPEVEIDGRKAVDLLKAFDLRDITKSHGRDWNEIN